MQMLLFILFILKNVKNPMSVSSSWHVYSTFTTQLLFCYKDNKKNTSARHC